MDTREVNLFVFDKYENFLQATEYLGEAGSSFKNLFCVENLSQFDHYLNNLGDDEFVCLVVHVFYTNKISGVRKFMASRIAEKYPRLGQMYISDGDEKEIMHMMVEARVPHASIYKYHEVYSNIDNDTVKVNRKKDIINSTIVLNKSSDFNSIYPQIDYAIITALYEDEFEELKKIFDFPDDKRILTPKKIFYRGYLKENKNIEVVAVIPNATGMVDTSIIATQILEFFKPKYLLMSGVCGGSNDLNIGDIVVGKQFYTFQKGKLSSLTEIKDDGNSDTIDIFDENKNQINMDSLFDRHQKPVRVDVEKFDIEHDSIISLDSLIHDKIISKSKAISSAINHLIEDTSYLETKFNIRVFIEPIACSFMVINKKDFFKDYLKPIHKRTAAVEMESYAVARACMFANDGKTIPIIFKSVMDNAFNKSDYANGLNAKKFAAFTSAQFMRNLFVEGII